MCCEFVSNQEMFRSFGLELNACVWPWIELVLYLSLSWPKKCNYLASGVGSCTGTSLGSLVMVSQLPNWPTSCLSLRVNSRSLDSRSSNTIPSFEKQKKQSISIQDGSDRERESNTETTVHGGRGKTT